METSQQKASFTQLFRYATRTDLIMIAISAIAALAAGTALPLMTVVFGSLGGSLSDYTNNREAAQESFHQQINALTLKLVYIAIGLFCATYVATVGFIHTGNNISARIRELYLRNVLRQNIGYFDEAGAGQIATHISVHTYLVQDGISQKVALALTAIATFLGAFVVGFVKYWRLTAILTSAIFAIALTTAILSAWLVRSYQNALVSYTQGGVVAEEGLSTIRETTAFGTQSNLARQYESFLLLAEKAGFKSKAISGSMIGVLMGYTYLTYALAFWLGGRYLVSGELSLSAFLTITQSIITGAFALGNIAPNIQATNTAIAAAGSLYSIIDRKSSLDPESDEGEKLESVAGSIELRNVTHRYPSRPDVVVVEDLSLKIPARKTTAIVGASGSGKSTIIALLERFYDPIAGEVFLDGKDIQSLNLRWLRQQFSLVSQDPVLFATTIAGNIEHGLIGTEGEQLGEKEKRILVENAAKVANAHDFIMKLPKGYETSVGDRGSLISVGQKQRIAIARAVIRNPKVLFLDEATSALDTKSEETVQAALDVASQGRTTIIIAHRLSTIKRADNIVVMSRGRIVEQGVHNDLIDRNGIYCKLVEAQKIIQRREENQFESLQEEGAGYGTDEFNFLTESLKDVDRLSLHDYCESIGPNGKYYMDDDGNDDIELAPRKSKGFYRAKRDKTSADSNKYSAWKLFKLTASLNREEWRYMLVGFVSSIINGGAQPVQTVFYAKSIAVLSLPQASYSELTADITFWSWMFFMLALVQLIFSLIQGISFAYCSERLVHKARYRSFRALLRQDIQFFDRSENTTGALTSFLSQETTNIAGISGSVLGTIIQVLVTLIACYVVSLAIGWKLALVCIGTVPVLLGCGFLRVWMLGLFQRQHSRAAQVSAAYASEATNAIRTVASLTRERDVSDNYHNMLMAQGRESLRSTLKSSILYAASQSLVLLCMGLALWYGSQLIGSQEYSIFQFFLCYSAVIFGSQSAGIVISFAPDISKAWQAASRLQKLFDTKPVIDSWSTQGETISDVKGSVEFRDIHFSYPSRPDTKILRGINLTVKAGQHVAVIGPSGCGKSTIIALLERFYDPLAGSIYLDGHDISDLNIKSFRRHFALVSQEPTLYQGTVRENVLLGVGEDSETVSEEAVVQACKNANIYDFILSLPQGFNTIVGSKGSMLSGGQKQRIAIARALLRDPKILLLDEATSALDSESETVVQAALDAAAEGRTTISVAHRLSTIQKADVIFIVDQGQIMEQGTHDELISSRGRYFDLVNMQSLEKTL